MAAYRLTLADIKASELADVASACPDTARFLSLVNQAQRRLLRRGNWHDTEWLVKFCIYDRCLTLPQYVATLLGLRTCQCGPAEIDNHWYAIDGPCAKWRGQLVVRDNGMGPTYNTVANASGSPIRYHVVKRADIGKTITLYGTQYGGQPLMEKDSAGNWRQGLTLTAAAPFAQTTTLITHITSVVREATSGPAYLYELYDQGAGTLRDLAVYAPNETNPRYRRYMMPNYNPEMGCEDANGRRIVTAEALVKLAFVPLVSDNDFLLLDNVDALKFMVQAIHYEEAGAFDQAEAFIAKAIREMNLEDRNLLPKEQTVIEQRTAGRGVLNLY